MQYLKWLCSCSWQWRVRETSFFSVSLFQETCIVSLQWSLEDLDIITMVCVLWTIVCRLLTLNRRRVLAKGRSCFGNNDSQVRCGRRGSLLFTRHPVSRNQLCTYDCKCDESIHVQFLNDSVSSNFCSILVFWHQLHFAMNVIKARPGSDVIDMPVFWSLLYQQGCWNLAYSTNF